MNVPDRELTVDERLRETLTEAIFVVNSLLFLSGLSDKAKRELTAYRDKWERVRDACVAHDKEKSS